MNLKYSILWFENEMDSMEPLVEDIKDYVENLGFKFSDPQIEQGGDNFDTIKYEDYDLILMDYKLSDNEIGSSLIKKIRDNQIYTDIVFYSSSTIPELRQAIHDQEIDGVYCVSRTADAFLSKVKSIINVTVKKVLDLNNMRGLVMAEVSDFDDKMKQIISLYLAKQEADTSNRFLTERKEKLMADIKKKLEALEKSPLDQLIESRDFEASHKWRTVKNIVKTEIKSLEVSINQYEEEILKKRNRLGHVKETVNEKGEKCLSDGDFAFNDAMCKQILTDLKKHSDNFDTIIRHLSQP
ncbi:hypothetical protein AGMMS49525_04190 [Bacteroidia bacterium]|nr:hypothetical protein AGMMS49525_04190 [Bacteroidia bacterium]